MRRFFMIDSLSAEEGEPLATQTLDCFYPAGRHLERLVFMDQNRAGRLFAYSPATRLTPLISLLGIALIAAFQPYGPLAVIFISFHTWRGIQNL
jgi:hypothetical protein